MFPKDAALCFCCLFFLLSSFVFPTSSSICFTMQHPPLTLMPFISLQCIVGKISVCDSKGKYVFLTYFFSSFSAVSSLRRAPRCCCCWCWAAQPSFRADCIWLCLHSGRVCAEFCGIQFELVLKNLFECTEIKDFIQRWLKAQGEASLSFVSVRTLCGQSLCYGPNESRYGSHPFHGLYVFVCFICYARFLV